MKDSISRSRTSSEPYSSGSDGSSTTSWASRLLRGEYGTRRADESMGTESAECHSPSLARHQQRGFQQPLRWNRGPANFTVHLLEQRREFFERHLGQLLDRPDRMVGWHSL